MTTSEASAELYALLASGVAVLANTSSGALMGTQSDTLETEHTRFNIYRTDST